MLIPLGILGASGAGIIPDYEHIANVFGNGSATSLTFSSIPSTYKHLQIRFTAKRTATNVSALEIRFNSDTSSSYAAHFLKGSGSSVTSGANTNQNTLVLFEAVARSTEAGRTSAGVIDILDYASTTKNTTVRSLHGTLDSNSNIYLNSGLYFQTSAIDSITFLGSTFSNVTRFSLYGIKG
jgi:hypothetical protein